MHQQHRANASRTSAPTPVAGGSATRVPIAPAPPAAPAPAADPGPPATVAPAATAVPPAPVVRPTEPAPTWPALPTTATWPPAPDRSRAEPSPADHGPAAPSQSQPTASDAREAARASLGAGRNPSLWWVCGGVLVCLLVTFLLGAAPGALVLSLVLAAGAVARATLRPGPVALSVRGRASDTAVLAALALAVGVLSQVFPAG